MIALKGTLVMIVSRTGASTGPKPYLRTELLAPWILAPTARRKPASAVMPYSSLQALRNSHTSRHAAHGMSRMSYLSCRGHHVRLIDGASGSQAEDAPNLGGQ